MFLSVLAWLYKVQGLRRAGFRERLAMHMPSGSRTVPIAPSDSTLCPPLPCAQASPRPWATLLLLLIHCARGHSFSKSRRCPQHLPLTESQPRSVSLLVRTSVSSPDPRTSMAQAVFLVEASLAGAEWGLVASPSRLGPRPRWLR